LHETYVEKLEKNIVEHCNKQYNDQPEA